jgi:hypothetical protein
MGGTQMTKEEIIEMAHKSGLHLATDVNWMPIIGLEYLEKFAKLVAEREREACAKLCDDRTTAYQYATDLWAQEHINEAKHLSQAIRARGKE